MIKERWKEIEGFPNYEVSDQGRVRNKTTKHILSPAIDKSTGYLKANLQKDGKGNTIAVHRLVAIAFCSGRKDGLDVNHIDGNKLNNASSNLEWCTRSENEKHAYETGLKASMKGKVGKPVRIIETGEVFNSLTECAEAIGGREHTISMCLNDKYNRTAHKGVHFEYVDDRQKEKKPFLYPYQMDAVKKMKNGCILNGGVGSGKSRTGLYYYFKEQGGSIDPDYIPMKDPRDLYIISTARKRDTCEWVGELSYFLISPNPEASYYKNKVVIDSWNNIKKYRDVHGAFFIFDEQRVVGSGTWVKSFLDITRKNDWILLSATPGDTWSDYIPVFVANGFYKNKTEFTRRHIVYSRFTKYPKVDRYLETGRLIRLRNSILVNMDFKRQTVSHHEDIYVKYDIDKYKAAGRLRWDPFKNEPIRDASGLCYVWRRIVNSDEARQVALLEIFEDHPKIIVFYNFDYELDILRGLFDGIRGVQVAEWNGHKHQPIPDGSASWVYLVQYAAGNEGWNCIKTDTIVFYSQNYSYKVMTQASGRIDRLNTPYIDLYYYHLKSRSGIDLAISKALKEKRNFNEGKFVNWG